MALMNDEGGMVVSAELAIVLTVSVLAMVVGLNGITGAVTGELNDISSAFGTIDQSFAFGGLTKFRHSFVAGSGYIDTRDFCDCTAIWSTGARIKSQCDSMYIAPPIEGPVVPTCPNGICPTDDKAPCVDCKPTDKDMTPEPEEQPKAPAQEAPAPQPTT
jgi:hypothetical protein